MKFGFIGFGEVSYTLSKALLTLGFEVLTSCEGRSKRTRDMIASLNMTVLDSFDEVSRESDVLISANSPQIALDIARKYANSAKGFFLDFNNISPGTVLEIEELSKGNFVDSAIFGRVNSGELNIYLSGSNAWKLLERIGDELSSKGIDIVDCGDFSYKINIGDSSNRTDIGDFDDLSINVKVINDRIGDVSRLKMLRSSYTKGVSALLVETFETAQKLGLEDELWDILALTENRDFEKSSKSRIDSSYKSSKRKYEELVELLDFLDDVDSDDGSKILAEAIKDKFEYLSKNS